MLSPLSSQWRPKPLVYIEHTAQPFSLVCDPASLCCSIACLAALQRYGECLALVNKRLETERDSGDLYVLRARLHRLFKNVSPGSIIE